MTQNASYPRWRILSDEEVSSARADAFGVHTAYAKLLQRVASNCPTPFAIGLYSTWGSGKTSIIRLLQEIISKEADSQLTVIYLDVWKFSADPLKRWILLETERQLKERGLLKAQYEFQGRSMRSHLEFEEDIEDRNTLEINFTNFRRLMGAITLFISASGLAWFYIPGTSRLGEALRWLMAASVGSGVFALILSAAAKKIGESLSSLVFRRTVRHITAKPAFSSEKFAEIFRDLVSKATDGKPNRRLMFVFDNLDRCPGGVAVEVLGVVRTFLDEPHCVYLVPCDEEAVLRHIKSSFLGRSQPEASDNYANQFLTKFFQMTLRLPPAADFAVEDYLDKELKEAGMEDLTSEARDVLVLGYRGETPRQVKRVLNDLIAYREIAEQIEAEGLVEPGALTADLGHLTKMAVLSVKWPSFMRRLADDPVLWTDVMQRIRVQADSGMESIANDLQQFLWNTRLVSPDADIRPWLYMRTGTLERDAALNRRIEGILQNGASQVFLDLLNDEALKDKKNEMLQILSTIMRKWQNNNRRVLLRNGAPVILKASLAVPENPELRKDALGVLDYLASNATPEELEQLFHIKDILPITAKAPAWQRNKLLTRYAEFFGTRYPSTEGRMEIWKELLDHGDLLDHRDKAQISGELIARYSSQPSGEAEVLSLLQFACEDSQTRGWPVTAQLLDFISLRINFDDSEIDKRRINCLATFRGALAAGTREALLNKIEAIVNPGRTGQPDLTAKAAIGTLKRFEPESWSAKSLKPVVTDLVEQAKRSAVSTRATWLGALIHLHPALDESSLEEMDALFRSTYVDADPGQTLELSRLLHANSRRKLLSFKQFITTLRSQAQNYHARFTSRASELRLAILDTFEALEILGQPAIFDDKLSWDLALFIRTADRAIKEKLIRPDDAGIHVEAFCSKYLPASLATQKDLYAGLLQFLDDNPESLRERLSDIVATCELSDILAGNLGAYGRFLHFKQLLQPNRRLTLVRELLPEMSNRVPTWVDLLTLVVDDVGKDKELSGNRALVRDLADYAFSAAREKPNAVGHALTSAVAFLDEPARQDYLDRSLDTLIALEADGEDLSKMEPFLRLVTASARHLAGPIAIKCGKFVQRMIGAGQQDPVKLRILQFAAELPEKVLEPIKSSVEQLAESPDSEVSKQAKKILGITAPTP